MRTICRLLFAAVIAALSAGVLAQAWPERPIRLVVPYAAGGGTDILGRQLAPRLSEIFGKQVLVDNRPGAGANLGALSVSTSTPDGYTLLLGDIALAVNPSALRDLPNPMKQLDPVALVASAPLVLIVHPSLAVSNVDELVKLAKKSPGRLTYGAAGGANPTTLAPEVFKQVEGLDILGVPYKGAGPALVDLISGQISMIFTGLSNAKPHIDSGRVRALAVTMKNRATTLPGVPTFAEAGHPLPDLDDGSWWGVLAPPGLPGEIRERIDRALQQVIQSAEFQRAVGALTIQATYADGRAFGELIRSQTEKWEKLIRIANIKAN